MLKRSPLFRPLLTHSPGFESVYRALVAQDRFSSFAYEQCLGFDVHNIHCVVRRDPVSHKDRTYLMLFPLTVTLASTNVFGTIHGGMLMTLVDMCSSFMIAEQLLPKTPGHVSVNLSTSFVSAAKQDDKLMVVCRVDKMGKRLAYASVDVLLDVPTLGSSSKTAETVEAVEDLLEEYTVVASGKQVKSIVEGVDLKRVI